MKKHFLKAMAISTAATLLVTGCGSVNAKTAAASKDAQGTEAADDSSVNSEKSETLSQNNSSEKSTEAIPTTDTGNAVTSVTNNIAIIGSNVTTNYDNLYFDSSAGEDTKLLAEGHYPTLELGSYKNGKFTGDSESHPELSKAIDDYNKEAYDMYKECMKSCEEMAADDDRFKEESEDNYGFYYTVDMDSSIQRSDDVIFSTFDRTSTFMGGAHPYTGYTGFNVDSKIGKVLKISDIVTDKEAFIDAVDKKLHEVYPDIEDGLLEEDLKQTIRNMYDGENDIDLQFYMDHDALEIMFSQYDLTAYAYGPEFVSLNYKDSEAFLKPEYLKVPVDYASMINFSHPMMISSDGKEKSLVVDYTILNPETYGDDTCELHITLDGKEYKEVIECVFEMRAYIMSKDNKSYLYVNCSTFNDWQYTLVYDLNGDTPVKVEDDSAQAIAFYDLRPADPSNFVMSTRGNLISTYFISRHYDMGDNGTPAAKTAYWWIESDAKLTLKAPATFSVMDELTEDGSDNGTKTEFPAGTVLTPVRTDDVDWVDVATPDGKFARIYVDDSDWPHTVDGTDIEELFDGIIFAG